MVRRDPADFIIGRVRADSPEEDSHFELPLLQVCAQKRWLLLVGDLHSGEGLRAATDAEPALPAGPKVLHPLGMTARRHKVVGAFEFQEVHRGTAPLTGGA